VNKQTTQNCRYESIVLPNLPLFVVSVWNHDAGIIRSFVVVRRTLAILDRCYGFQCLLVLHKLCGDFGEWENLL